MLRAYPSAEFFAVILDTHYKTITCGQLRKSTSWERWQTVLFNQNKQPRLRLWTKWRFCVWWPAVRGGRRERGIPNLSCPLVKDGPRYNRRSTPVYLRIRVKSRLASKERTRTWRNN